MNTKAIIFGVNGQDGFYLSNLLAAKGINVVGVSRSAIPGVIQGNVKDFGFVAELIKYHQPEFVFHFAANSTTRHDAIFENHESISTGAINILEAVKLYAPAAKVFLSGSAMQFKNSGVPIDESTPFDASSPYAIARIQSVYAARYFRSIGLNVYVGYFFNHDSPLRTDRHLNQKIAAAVVRISQGSNEKIQVGNPDVKKEFNYAGDIVNAVWLLVNQEKYAEAVIGCGKAHSIREWADICFGMIGKKADNFLIPNPQFIPEYDILVSNPVRIFEVGYQPETSIRELAKMMITS